MITLLQAQQFLASQGLAAPDFIVQAAVDKVAAAEPAMNAAGYSASDKVLIQSMAVALVSGAGAPRQVSSQTAPSGASQSFKYATNALTALRRALAALDTAGTVTQLIGPDPASSTLLMVVC